ncbi:MAG TPA: hypothetical protein VFR47_21310 [Anaerolineales bacterium]|nr:hypothetical protein [Anaerolineales bacterium]
MARKTLSYLLFGLGVLLLEMHTTLAVLWQITGAAGRMYPLSSGTVLYYAQGFTPMLGVLTLFIAGLVYEK